jgi:hypothetical protein
VSRRRCPRDVWLAEVYRTKRVGDRCVRVLLYMGTAVDADGRRLMDERGYFRQHWGDTAKALGITDLRRLSERWTEAVKAGLLVRAAGGRNGQVTMFLAQVTEPQVPGKLVPTPSRRYRVASHLPMPETRYLQRRRRAPQVPEFPGPYAHALLG